MYVPAYYVRVLIPPKKGVQQKKKKKRDRGLMPSQKKKLASPLTIYVHVKK